MMANGPPGGVLSKLKTRRGTRVSDVTPPGPRGRSGWGKRQVRKLILMLVLAAPVPALATSVLFEFVDASGLSAEVEFTLLDPTTLEIRARNTSTGVPAGFDSSDQILTGVSWDFGLPGYDPADPFITGGWVIIGLDSSSVNFDMGFFGPLADISGEYGYGNSGGSGALQNLLTTNSAQAIPFGGPNLDGPENLDGPQGGLVADPILVGLGGLGAIRNEIIGTVMLSAPIGDLGFLFDNQVRVEFGSDVAFITVPEPATAGLLLLGAAALLRRRRT